LVVTLLNKSGIARYIYATKLLLFFNSSMDYNSAFKLAAKRNYKYYDNALVMVLLTEIIMMFSAATVMWQTVHARKHYKKGQSVSKYKAFWSNSITYESNRNRDRSMRPSPLVKHRNSRPVIYDGPIASASQYEHLCASETTTIHLSTMDEEFNPPFYHEIRCTMTRRNRRHHNRNQKCGFGLFHCVQTYRRLYFSRRKAGTDCWQPHYIDAPSGCECMWPVEEYGSLNRRHEL
ncbi:hypothetical protein T4A_11592, partial [Trichinella pseudospiralis]